MVMKSFTTLVCLAASLLVPSYPEVASFQMMLQMRPHQATTTTTTTSSSSIRLHMAPAADDDTEKQVEYRNAATNVLSNFMMSKDDNEKDPLAGIDFDAPKLDRKKERKIDLETFAAILDAELYQREWFVTGNVNPSYFSDDFVFQDPDVRLEGGIEAYARNVNKLFDQDCSRAEIISTAVVADVKNAPNNTIITCTWRLSGKVDIGPAGLTIKPYIVTTDFHVDPDTGLIIFQEDRFDIPGWDIVLSALFPFLIGKVTAPPAPPVKPRGGVVEMPKKLANTSPLEGVLQQLFAGIGSKQ